MAKFEVIAKHWPSGAPIINVGTRRDTFTLTPPQTFDPEDTAAEFVTNGVQQYQFLFWNTGRRITRKRRVLWNFKRSDWGRWIATKWYGTPPTTGGGPARVRADAFMISDDAPMSGTPIDANASTYVAGAYPFPPPPDPDSSDHAIGTAAGGANVVAKDPFPGCGIVGPQEIVVLEKPSNPFSPEGMGSPFSLGKVISSYAVSSCDFAGWLQLVWGGEEMGEFQETDTLPDGSSGFGVYDHVVGGPFSVRQGNSADIIAAYGIGTHYINSSPPLREWIYKVPLGLPPSLDPLGPIREFILQAFPGLSMSTELERLIKDVPEMNREELGRAMQAIERTLDRGKTALSMIEMQIKRGGN